MFLACPVLAQAPMMESARLGSARNFMLAASAARLTLAENGDPALRSRIYQLAFAAQGLGPVLTELNTGVGSINALLASMVKTEQGIKELRRYIGDFRRKIINKVYKPIDWLKHGVDMVANITPDSKAGPAAEALKSEALRLRVLCEGLIAATADLVATTKFYQPGQMYDEVLDLQQDADLAAAAVDGLIEQSEALVNKARQDQGLPGFR